MSRALALLVLLSLGCAEAIISRTSYRSHDAYSEEAYAAFAAKKQGGLIVVSKADVLATLGPPIQVIPQDQGEIFVYRRVSRSANTLNINPSMVSGLGPTVPIPLYYARSSKGRNDTLMIFFDEKGMYRAESVRFDIEEGVLP